MGEFRPLAQLAKMGVSLAVEELYPKENKKDPDVVRKVLNPREDGYLGSNIENMRLVFLYENDLPIRFFDVGGTKKIRRKHDHRDEEGKPSSSRMEIRHRIKPKMGDPYDEERNRQFVRKGPTDRDFVRTPSATNNVRMVEFGDLGKVQMHKIGVKSQDGELYLRIQLIGFSWAYWIRRHNRQQVAFTVDFGPDWNEWPEFQERVRECSDEGLIELTDIVAEPDDEVEDLTEGLRKGFGRIVWYDELSDTGCIVLAPGETYEGEPIEEAKLHWRQVITESAFEVVDLERGDLVSYQSLGPIPENTRHGNSFKAQALAVQVLEED